MYNTILFTNVLRLLDELRMTKQELADISGVSLSYISDLTTGQANPSLKVLEAIAEALDVPLPLLLEKSDWEPEMLQALQSKRHPKASLPPGFERVTAILPAHQAFLVRKWHEQTLEKIRKSHQ
ncbi:helix-turn-helix domain-containing protein [Thiocystis violacea]|uniref:helix-turn-helix domain-containing protein n=1 Tax=Thiocystis violacea TaxID=13725 RepID=UPI0019067FCD|nr:transcriptional regulator [Thiocystis violacea]